MPFASMTDEDVAAFYMLLDEYFESRKDMFASWVNARAPAAAAASATPTSVTGRTTAREPMAYARPQRFYDLSIHYNAAAPPPAVSSAYRPSTPASPPAVPASPSVPAVTSPSAAAASGRSSSAANNKYGITVPSMGDFKDPRFQTAFNVAGKGASKAGGLLNKHVFGGVDHSKTPDAAAPGAVAPAGPPPKAAKPGGFGKSMSDMRDMANGLKAMNNLNQRFSPQQQQAEAGAPAPPPPPPVMNPAAAALPPPARHTGPPPVRAAAGIGSCTAQFDYQSAESGDLSFREGDVITLLSKESADWWKGSLHGAEGIFPAAYVQEH